MKKVAILLLFNHFFSLYFRSQQGKYLGATKNGAFKLLDDGTDSATQWEF